MISRISREDWVDLSLAGDDEEAYWAQSLTSREERLKLDEWRYLGAEELPDVRVPVPPSPGFERLAAIMDHMSE